MSIPGSRWSAVKLLVLFVAILGFCAPVVEGGKIRLTKQQRLATVFAGPSFTGNYFSIDGIYRSCYNVLHNAKISSVTLESGTAYCEIWGVEDCGEGEDYYGNDRPREVFGPITSLEWDGVGESKGKGKEEIKRDRIEESGIKSLRCFDKPLKQ